MIRVAIVDDEPLARRRLERLVAREPDLVLQGSFEHPLDARVSLGEVELLLLDIEMPGGNGFDLLQALRPGQCRQVIVVTAHAAHALPAFGHRAIDFLLKPYDDAAFAAAVARVRLQLRAEDALAQGPASAPGAPAAAAPATPVALRVPGAGGTWLLDPAQVSCVRADGREVLLHAGQDVHRVTGRLAEFERRLAALGFVRVHRAALVNLARVRRLQPCGHGDRLLELDDGQCVRVSRRFAAALDQRLL
jgi:two-component system LytT family response regulator